MIISLLVISCAAIMCHWSILDLFMLPRRSSNPSLSSSRQQKYLINSEVCLPKIVNKLVIRKPSYQNRWMTPILGSHKREYRSLQAFES